MNYLIKDIGNISSGLVVARKKAFQDCDVVKKYYQLNLRSFNKNGYIELEELEEFDSKEIINDDYLTHEGDIVVRFTDPFTAVYIDKQHEGYIISSNFCVIRCNGKYNAIFLTYLLNSEEMRKEMFANQQGSIMKNINIAVLENLTIPKLKLSIQVEYAQLFLAQTKRIRLAEKIKELEILRQKSILSKVMKEVKNVK